MDRLPLGINSNALTSLVGKNEFAMVDCTHTLGFDSLDLTVDGTYFPLDDTESAIAHYQKLYDYATKRRIVFGQIHAKYTTYPYFAQECYLSTIRLTFHVAKILHAPIVVMHPPVYPTMHDASSLSEFDMNVEFFKQFIPLLQKLNLKVAIENIYDWKGKEIRLIAASSPKTQKALLCALKSDRFGFCLDTGHLHIAGENITQTITSYGEDLLAVHLHDNHGKTDEHLPLGEGSLSVEDLIQGLSEISFKGVFSLELKPLSSELTFYKRVYDNAKALSQRLLLCQKK